MTGTYKMAGKIIESPLNESKNNVIVSLIISELFKSLTKTIPFVISIRPLIIEKTNAFIFVYSFIKFIKHIDTIKLPSIIMEVLNAFNMEFLSTINILLSFFILIILHFIL